MAKDSTRITSKKLHDLLPKVMAKVEGKFHTKPHVLMEAWPEIIGAELAQMARADRFEDGVLYVKVRNSTALSLFNNPHDKQRLLESIRMKLSGISIRNIVFRIG